MLAFVLLFPVLVQAGEQAVRVRLLKLEPDLPIEQVTATPMAGVYQIRLRGGQILYVDETVQFIFQGELYQVQNGLKVNLTEQARQTMIVEQLMALKPEEMVVFPAVQAKTAITVFTDPASGYSQKLHAEVAELNRSGVEVRYLAFLNHGLASASYAQLVSIWCSNDRQKAMTQAQQKQKIAATMCKNPVEKQYALGQMIGVQSAPTIILPDGTVLTGYMPARQLIDRLFSGL